MKFVKFFFNPKNNSYTEAYWNDNFLGILGTFLSFEVREPEKWITFFNQKSIQPQETFFEIVVDSSVTIYLQQFDEENNYFTPEDIPLEHFSCPINSMIQILEQWQQLLHNPNKPLEVFLFSDKNEKLFFSESFIRSVQVPAKEEDIKGNEDLVILYLFLGNVIRSNYNCVKDFLWLSKESKVFGNGDITLEKKEQNIILKSPSIDGSFIMTINKLDLIIDRWVDLRRQYPENYNFFIKEINSVIFIEPIFD